VWRSVHRMEWIGVKSRFSNSSMGEPVSLAIPKIIEAVLPDKPWNLVKSSNHIGTSRINVKMN